VSADAAARLAAAPHTSGLFCDFDGVLTPIAADPAAPRLSDEHRHVLARLARCLGVVGVISGRPVGYLAEHAAVPGVRLLGLYGLEEHRDGAMHTRAEAAAWQPSVEAAMAELSRDVADLAGVQIEDKGLSVAVHWRNAADRGFAAERVTQVAAAVAARTGLAREPGKLVAELRPPVGWDKGASVRALTAELKLTALVYLGDDLGDVPAMQAALELGGLAIAVDHGDETPAEVVRAASATLAGTEGVLEWLGGLAASVDG
jgi:trehalose 6-phosphate phosphatase